MTSHSWLCDNWKKIGTKAHFASKADVKMFVCHLHKSYHNLFKYQITFFHCFILSGSVMLCSSGTIA